MAVWMKAVFLDQLLAASRSNDSLLCVGLDVDPALAPRAVMQRPNWITAFIAGLVEATSDLVCAYKPNLAFFEAQGVDGWMALTRIRELVPRRLPIIGDAKRADVGHTSAAYASCLFEELGFDAATVNPYLGFDSLDPFLQYANKGVLVLCKTSNPGSADFQDLPCQLDDRLEPLYMVVARKVVGWNQVGNCGLVVGATYPDQLKAVRQVAQDLPLLIPGIGAQAGDLEASVRNGVDSAGELAILNVSRQVIYASDGPDWAEATRTQAMALRDQINRFRRP